MRIPVTNKVIVPGLTQIYAVAGYFVFLAALFWKECIKERNNPEELGAIFGLNIFCIMAGLLSIFALFAVINAGIHAHVRAGFDNSQDAARERRRLVHNNIVKKDFNE